MHLIENRSATLSPPLAPSAVPTGDIAVIEAAFGVPFAVLEVRSGNVVHRGDGLPSVDIARQWAIYGEVARRGSAELIEEHDPFWLLALPILGTGGTEYVAVTPLVGRLVSPAEDLAAAAKTLGLAAEEAAAWAAGQTPWAADALLQMAEMVLDKLRSRQRIERLETDVRLLSRNINSTYEEINLLHRLTQNLRLSQSDEHLGGIALEWLDSVVPARGIVLCLAPAGRSESLGSGNQPQEVYLTHGDCPIGREEFGRLVEHIADHAYMVPEPGSQDQPLVLNRAVTAGPDWPCPQIRQAIFAPLVEGNHRFGWMAALNHVADGEFGSGEASLLSSVAVILGVHSGNILLYQQQAELTAGIIRALTEAIEAKDQYTCGHSDRVARIAVRLAQEMDLDLHSINTIYLAGLLHDIGKIGVADEVLRKPGKLTAEEYEHIKTHTVIGHRILRDIKQLDQILPIILHHHESFDGAGYPMRLAAAEIPLSARILAVADAYDAMGSDRPYREGLPEDKIDEIFRKESGIQWDPNVVAAFFRVKDNLRGIVNDTRRDLPLDLRAWPS